MPDLDTPTPAPEPPPLGGRRIPEVSVPLQPHVIKPGIGLLDAADVAFLKKCGLYSSKAETKVFMGGPESPASGQA